MICLIRNPKQVWCYGQGRINGKKSDIPSILGKYRYTISISSFDTPHTHYPAEKKLCMYF